VFTLKGLFSKDFGWKGREQALCQCLNIIFDTKNLIGNPRLDLPNPGSQATIKGLFCQDRLWRIVKP
jgi:hypothetical protein